VKRLAGSWTEHGITWATQPSTEGPAAATTSGSGYREWDVTDQVRAMYQAGANHGFLVRDAAENADAEQQFYSREKGENPPGLLLTFAAPSGADTDAPETTIGAAPPLITRDSDASFGFSADEEGATFQCSLDGAAFASCAAPVEHLALAAREHTFRVRAVDASGNVDDTPAAYTWTVDYVLPETRITGAAGDSVSFAGTDEPVPGAPLSFSCSLDGSAFTPCTSPAAVGGLPDGEHELAVRATDQAGNIDETPARHTWTVAEPPPRLESSQAPQGTWTTSYGAGGYALGAWNGTSELRLRLDFAAAWSGDLHLYALDWDNRARRQTVTVDDGSGPRVAALDSAFTDGRWVHAPITVEAGGSAYITLTRAAGTNAVLSGLFLGGGRD
jgi:hypothetical protein